MLVKFFNKDYDKLDEDGYYLYSLKNNSYKDKFINFGRISLLPYNDFHLRKVKSNIVSKDVLLNRLREELPKYEDNSNKVLLDIDRRPNSIPLIGEYKDGVLRDVITGKVINEELPGLTYEHVIKISYKVVKDVLANINLDDLKNYSNTLLKIEEDSMTQEKTI